MNKLFGLIILSCLLFMGGQAQAATPLVSVDWVKNNLGKEGIVFLDVRGPLAGKTKADYLRGHIPGAVWTDYLMGGWRVANKDKIVGMLPPVTKLEKLIGGLGIGNNDHVVIIPNGGKALDVGTATRVYWTFKVLGHENVSILNGGMVAYLKDMDAKTKKPVNPLEKGMVKVAAKSFKGSLQQAMIINKADVSKASKTDGVLVDNRPHNQFIGINKHPKATRFGTIPNSKSLPENWLTKNGGGMFSSPARLNKLYTYASIPTKGSQINFCNTGHWASLGWFVSHEILGNKEAKMYDGSMAEWTADNGLPMQETAKIN
jgi:thiosulfate/3-mercaptopyruvate sulfurtransferase